GLTPPTSGGATVAGFSVTEAPLEVKRRIGVAPEKLGLYERLTAVEQIELVGRLHGLSQAELDRRVTPLLEALELGDSAGKMVVDFSAGMRKKTAIAAALIHAPEVLFLDEPFESVDPISTRVIKDILRDMVDRRGATVFFSTHVMDLAERFCDQVAIINRGRLVAQGSVEGLRQVAGLSDDAPLEDVFVRIVQAQGPKGSQESLLQWLTGEGESDGG
ncbi:MAG: ABC transporter ATP-binding protein, partial [Chloroflexi bacterium]|nr:ABC transporter ATP-binding protein [Chloroflexota bacterium]